jgi:glycerophosphoryl diester phosphodiesterase
MPRDYIKKQKMTRRYYSILVFMLMMLCFFNDTKAQQIAMPLKGLCAHRGAWNVYPENTLPAFKEAIRLKVQMVEFDVRLTKDSVLVIMHDADVDRTTNGTGKIADLTYAEIEKFDAGIKRGPQFVNTKVPTLQQVLDIMPTNVWLNCDVKGSVSTAMAAFAIVKKQNRLHQVFFACDEPSVNALKKEMPTVLTCNMDAKFRKKDLEIYATSAIRIKTNFVQITRPMKLDASILETLKKNNIQINYFYAIEPAELDNLFALGVNFVLVNDIPAFQKMASKFGIKPVNYIYKTKP